MVISHYFVEFSYGFVCRFVKLAYICSATISHGDLFTPWEHRLIARRETGYFYAPMSLIFAPVQWQEGGEVFIRNKTVIHILSVIYTAVHPNF